MAQSWPHRALGRAQYRIFSLRHADPRLGQQSYARRAGLHAARLWLARGRVPHHGGARQIRYSRQRSVERRGVRATSADHRRRQQAQMGMARPRHDQQRFHARLPAGRRALDHSQGERDHHEGHGEGAEGLAWVRDWARPAIPRIISLPKDSNTSAIGATTSSRRRCASKAAE